MTSEFPPTPAHPDQMLGLLEVYRSLITGREAWYVSTPLTTGERMRQLSSHTKMSAPDYDSRVIEQVIEPNRRQAQAFVQRLRSEIRYVISPAAVQDIAGWTQSDYRHFWGLVIEQFCQSIVFLDGWYLSSGCAWEFLVANETGVTTLDERRHPLPLSNGIKMMQRALEETGTSNNDFLRKALGALENLRKERDV